MPDDPVVVDHQEPVHVTLVILLHEHVVKDLEAGRHHLPGGGGKHRGNTYEKRGDIEKGLADDFLSLSFWKSGRDSSPEQVFSFVSCVLHGHQKIRVLALVV